MRNLLILFFLVLIGFSACEPNNPYDMGPAYDYPGNLKADSLKIVAYLDTAQIDSLYRIHDPSGVVIIVQEEGVGSRPTNGTVVYTDYTGSLISDGSVFDTSIEQVAKDHDIYNENRNYSIYQFRVDLVSYSGEWEGWHYAFPRLKPGSKAVLIIPSPRGYQSRENIEGVPANSVLRFDVDFYGID